ncbi:DUF551 domain-containing protein [Rhizobium leguminosarum bv. viciae]|uniref:DUF551 domain-containing protein n=1 Tax=Rhizobium leguminosarum bv. viciae TaxID=387 RepID=A0A7G6RL52_RHILV|nr:DUF551 domain-containing protein [Rhizobium leguminosarum bv. viciae]
MGEWQPIETYHSADQFSKVEHVLCGHAEKKWMRFGRYYPEMKRWYYSGTNERSQWAQVEGDAPTHWQLLPKPPVPTPNTTLDEQEREA